MKSKLSSLAAISLALSLCSCVNMDKEPKNTEPTDYFQTATASMTTAMPESTEEEAQTEFTLSADDILLVSNAEKLDTITYYGEEISLYFSGEKNGGTWNGSLFLSNKSPDRENKISYLFKDESFDALTPPIGKDTLYAIVSDNGYLQMDRDDLLIFRRTVNGKNTLRLYNVSKHWDITPISIIYDDDYADMISGDYELLAENISDNYNTYINYGDIEKEAAANKSRYAYGCYTYSDDIYIEYAVDPRSCQMAITGSFPLYADNDVTAAVAEAAKMLFFGGGYELRFDNTYTDSLTYIGNDPEREEAYYRLSRDIAYDRESLTALVRAPFTDHYADMMGLTEEQLFDANYPCFMADDEGIIYVDAYRGVPVRTVFDSIKMKEADDDTAAAVSYGDSLDGRMLSRYSLVKENSVWKINNVECLDYIGDYFGNKTVYYPNFNVHLNYTVRPDVFNTAAGEEFTAAFTATPPPTGASMAADSEGNVIIGGFAKAEDFTGIDLSELSETAADIADNFHDTERTFTYTPEESGKYILWAACRYYTADGESCDLVIGPQIINVK